MNDRVYQVVPWGVIQIGWLPYGVREAARGHLLAGILGSLGATALGLASLLRSYRTTLRFYRGETGPRKTSRKTGWGHAIESDAVPMRTNFLEKKLKWASESVAAVCLASFRSMIRAPEVKLMLLTPVILFVVFGALLFAWSDGGIPEIFRPALALGAISATLVCFVQLQCNVFGFDRGGFRVFVLSPCRRQDILLGKNLSIAPLAIGMCVLALAALQALFPMQISHLLAALLRYIHTTRHRPV